MIDEILKEINNYFIRSAEYRPFTILSNEIVGFGETYIAGQYINIDGSILNDGTYKIASNVGGVITTVEDLQDETGWFYLFGLGVPKQITDLSTKLSTYTQSVNQGLTSESQGNRSVSYAYGSSWQAAYKKDLNAYRMAISDKVRWKRCGRPTQLNY